jgi:ribosomal protein S18 acetylase RimI-like enzyme
VSVPSIVTIRPATPADAAGISQVFLESAEHHARLDPDRYFVPTAEAIRNRYREGRQHPNPAAHAITLVALIDDTVVGFVDARLDRPLDAMHRDFIYCYIAEIAVAAAQQSRGVGEQLLRAAEEWGRENSAEYALLEYLAENSRAASFYHQRMGYRVASVLAAKRLKTAEPRP